jgi:hypothetical protein
MMQLVTPLLEEQWIVDGKTHLIRPGEDDALYIRPLLNSTGVVPAGIRVIHSLVLDNNVLSDLVENRRPNNNKFLIDLVRTKPIELNPVFAMIEQRQKYAGATAVLHAYSEYLEENFGWSAAKIGAAAFDSALASAKEQLISNIDLLSGYLGATIFLYHQDAPASQKLEWLSGMIQSSDIPYLQLQFYFAALLFLTRERPDLFRTGDLEKVRSEMKLESSFEKQKKKVLNLSNDLALPAVSIFPTATPNQLVWPYVATRDKLVQLFLSEVSCGLIETLPDGRANGSWALKSTGVVNTHLGPAIAQHLPRRLERTSPQQRLVRKSRLQAFSEQYIQKCVEM